MGAFYRFNQEKMFGTKWIKERGRHIREAQSDRYHEHFHYQQILLTPSSTLNTGCFASGAVESTLDFHINGMSGKKLYQAILEFEINESGGANPVKIAMSPYFVNRIEYLNQKNEIINTMNDDDLFEILTANQSEEHLKKIGPMHGIDAETLKPHVSTTIAASGKRKYFLWLFGDWIGSQLDGVIADWDGFVTLRLYLKGSIIESGSGNVGCSAINLRLYTKHAPNDTNTPPDHGYKFLDHISRVVETKTISSSETIIKLTGLIGHDMQDSVSFRTSNAIANGAYRNFSSLGSNPQFVVYSPEGTNIVGGSSLDGDQLRNMDATFHYAGYFYKMYPIYPIIWGSVEAGTKSGIMEGALYQNTNNQLGIRASSLALTAPVLTITPSGTSASGGYALRFTSPVTGQTCETGFLLFSSDAAAIKAALEGLPNWDDSSINTVTASGALTAAATLTFAGKDYTQDFAHNINASTVVCIPIGAATSVPALVTFATTYTTAAVAGFTQASLTVTVRSSLLREVVVHRNGLVEVNRLLD